MLLRCALNRSSFVEIRACLLRGCLKLSVARHHEIGRIIASCHLLLLILWFISLSSKIIVGFSRSVDLVSWLGWLRNVPRARIQQLILTSCRKLAIKRLSSVLEDAACTLYGFSLVYAGYFPRIICFGVATGHIPQSFKRNGANRVLFSVHIELSGRISHQRLLVELVGRVSLVSRVYICGSHFFLSRSLV